MEQEPVYVASGRLESVCAVILSKIYDIRQCDKEDYILARVAAYNTKVEKSNKYRKYLGWLGIKPRYHITPHGMELLVRDELSDLEPARQPDHPIVEIHKQYGDLEHQTKDCLIQCAMNETVPISASMVRGISHLGVPLDFMSKPRFGFYAGAK